MKFLEWKIPAASCEQLFLPDLRGKPTVVLSNDQFINAKRAKGYSAIVSLKCFNDEMRADTPDTIAKKGNRALEKLWSKPKMAQV